VRVDPGQLGVRGQEPELLLPGEDAVADGLVAVVEDTLVLVRPLLEDVVGRVSGVQGEVEEERLLRLDDLASWMNRIALSERSFAMW